MMSKVYEKFTMTEDLYYPEGSYFIITLPAVIPGWKVIFFQNVDFLSSWHVKSTAVGIPNFCVCIGMCLIY